MAESFEIVIREEGQPDESLTLTLSEEQVAALREYVERYNELAKSIAGDEIPNSFKLNVSKGSATTQVEVPNADMMAVLLHRLRPFALENERTSFSSVASIIGKNVDDLRVRQLLKQERRLYDGRSTQESLKIESNGILLNSETVLKDWLNSHEYHTDADKKAEVAALFAALPEGLSNLAMVTVLGDKREAVCNLAALVWAVLGDDSEFEYRVEIQVDGATRSFVVAPSNNGIVRNANS